TETHPMDKRFLSAAGALLLLTVAACANAPPPWPPPLPQPPAPVENLQPLPDRFARQPAPNKVRLVLKFWEGDSQPRLRLPAKILKAADEAKPTKGASLTPTRSSYLVAGIALALGLTLSGLWLARGGRRRVIGGAGILLVLVAMLGISGCPPSGPSSLNFYES